MVAPMARKPVTWKSMPRRPMESPPGIGSAAAPQRAQQCAEQQHLGAHAGGQLGIDPLRLRAIGRIVTARPESLADQCMPQPQRAMDVR